METNSLKMLDPLSDLEIGDIIYIGLAGEGKRVKTKEGKEIFELEAIYKGMVWGFTIGVGPRVKILSGKKQCWINWTRNRPLRPGEYFIIAVQRK